MNELESQILISFRQNQDLLGDDTKVSKHNMKSSKKRDQIMQCSPSDAARTQDKSSVFRKGELVDSNQIAMTENENSFSNEDDQGQQKKFVSQLFTDLDQGADASLKKGKYPARNSKTAGQKHRLRNARGSQNNTQMIKPDNFCMSTKQAQNKKLMVGNQSELSHSSAKVLEKNLEQNIKEQQQKLILNLGQSYNRITLDKLHKQKKALIQAKQLNKLGGKAAKSEKFSKKDGSPVPSSNQEEDAFISSKNLAENSSQAFSSHLQERSRLGPVQQREKQSSNYFSTSNIHLRNISRLQNAQDKLQNQGFEITQLYVKNIAFGNKSLKQTSQQDEVQLESAETFGGDNAIRRNIFSKHAGPITGTSVDEDVSGADHRVANSQQQKSRHFKGWAFDAGHGTSSGELAKLGVDSGNFQKQGSLNAFSRNKLSYQIKSQSHIPQQEQQRERRKHHQRIKSQNQIHPASKLGKKSLSRFHNLMIAAEADEAVTNYDFVLKQQNISMQDIAGVMSPKNKTMFSQEFKPSKKTKEQSSQNFGSSVLKDLDNAKGAKSVASLNKHKKNMSRNDPMKFRSSLITSDRGGKHVTYSQDSGEKKQLKHHSGVASQQVLKIDETAYKFESQKISSKHSTKFAFPTNKQANIGRNSILKVCGSSDYVEDRRRRQVPEIQIQRVSQLEDFNLQIHKQPMSEDTQIRSAFQDQKSKKSDLAVTDQEKPAYEQEDPSVKQSSISPSRKHLRFSIEGEEEDIVAESLLGQKRIINKYASSNRLLKRFRQVKKRRTQNAEVDSQPKPQWINPNCNSMKGRLSQERKSFIQQMMDNRPSLKFTRKKKQTRSPKQQIAEKMKLMKQQFIKSTLKSEGNNSESDLSLDEYHFGKYRSLQAKSFKNSLSPVANVAKANYKLTLAFEEVNLLLSNRDKRDKKPQVELTERPVHSKFLNNDKEDGESSKESELAVARQKKSQFEFLANISKEIRLASQACQRLVLGQDGLPLITQSKYAHIELTADNPVSFRLRIEGLVSPIRFIMEPENLRLGKQTTWAGRRFSDIQLSVKKGAKKQKDIHLPVEVFFSTQCKTPNSKSYEVRFFSERSFKIHADQLGMTNPLTIQKLVEKKIIETNKEKRLTQKELKKQIEEEVAALTQQTEQVEFKDTILYMTLVSMRACSVRFKYNQSALRQNAVKLKLAKIKQQREDMQKNILKYFTTDDPYYQEMLREEEKIQESRARFAEIMLENPMKYYFGEPKEVTVIRNRRWMKRWKESKKRRSQAELDLFKRNVFNLSRWEYIKKFKIEMKVYFHKLYKRKFGCQELLKNLFLLNYLKQVAEVHRLNLIEVTRKQKAEFLTFILKQKISSKLKVRGKDPQQRIQITGRNIINLIGFSIHETKYRECQKIFADLMLQWSWQQKLSLLIRNMVVQVEYIISKFRRAREINMQRKFVLETSIWEEEMMRLCKILTGQDGSSSSQQKKLWIEVTKTTKEKKDFIINLYYYRQKLEGKINFMEWYREDQQIQNKINEQGQLILSVSSEFRSDTSMSSEEDSERERREEKEQIKSEMLTRKFINFGNRLESLKSLLALIDKFLEKGVNKYKLTEKKKKKKLQDTEKQVMTDDVDRSSVYITELHANQMKKTTVLNSLNSEIDSAGRDGSRDKYVEMKELEVSEQYYKNIRDNLKNQKQQHLSVQDHHTDESQGNTSRRSRKSTSAVNAFLNQRKPMPKFVLLQKNKDNVVKKLMIRAALAKKSEIRNFEKKLIDHLDSFDLFNEKLLYHQYVQ